MTSERQRDFHRPDHFLQDIERAIAALPVEPAWLASYLLTPGPIRRARLVIGLARTVAAAVSEARAGAGEAPENASAPGVERPRTADGLIDVDHYTRQAARLLVKRLRSRDGLGAPAPSLTEYTP